MRKGKGCLSGGLDNCDTRQRYTASVKGRWTLANYVETIVGPGEQVLYVGKVSLFSILPSLIGGALLILVGGAFTVGAGPVGLIFAVLGLIVILVALIRRNSTELAVTNRR